jgi:hypothetical protein
MLGLRLGRLKRAGEDGNLDIPQLLRHLRMREVLIHNDPLHQHAVLHASSHLRLQLDQLKVDISRLQIGDSHDGVDSDARHLLVAFVDDLGAEGRLRRAHQVFRVVDREGVGDGVQVPKIRKTCNVLLF